MIGLLCVLLVEAQPLVLDALMPPMVPAAVVATNTICVSLAWDAVTNLGVTGYKVYWGGRTGGYTNASATAATNASICGLGRTNTYYFAVTATNNAGMESDFSQEVVFPAPATNVVSVRVQLLTNATLASGAWGAVTNALLLTLTNVPGAQFFGASLSISSTNTAMKVLRVNSSTLLFTNK